eukprot:1137202-Pelagomonas_calceolata.AAC.3
MLDVESVKVCSVVDCLLQGLAFPIGAGGSFWWPLCTEMHVMCCCPRPGPVCCCACEQARVRCVAVPGVVCLHMPGCDVLLPHMCACHRPGP